MSSLLDKAHRVAAWFTAQGWEVRYRGERWTAYSPNYDGATIDLDDILPESVTGSSRILIAFAKDHGWRDDEKQCQRVDREGIMQALREIVKEQGSQKAAAEALAISPQYLSDLLAGRRDVSKNLAERMGYDLVVSFFKIGEPE